MKRWVRPAGIPLVRPCVDRIVRGRCGAKVQGPKDRCATASARRRRQRQLDANVKLFVYFQLFEIFSFAQSSSRSRNYRHDSRKLLPMDAFQGSDYATARRGAAFAHRSFALSLIRMNRSECFGALDVVEFKVQRPLFC